MKKIEFFSQIAFHFYKFFKNFLLKFSSFYILLDFL